MKRNIKLIDYPFEIRDFFMFMKRAIRYVVKKSGRYDIHLFEVVLMKVYKEKQHYAEVPEGKGA